VINNKKQNKTKTKSFANLWNTFGLQALAVFMCSGF